MEQGCNGLTYVNDIASPWRHGDAFLYTTALLYFPHSTAVNELGRRHHKQVEVFEALGVTGDDEYFHFAHSSHILSVSFICAKHKNDYFCPPRK